MTRTIRYCSAARPVFSVKNWRQTDYGIEAPCFVHYKKLEQDVVTLREWFKNNHMKLNMEKCYQINFSKSNNNTSLKIYNTIIRPSKE